MALPVLVSWQGLDECVRYSLTSDVPLGGSLGKLLSHQYAWALVAPRQQQNQIGHGASAAGSVTVTLGALQGRIKPHKIEAPRMADPWPGRPLRNRSVGGERIPQAVNTSLSVREGVREAL